LYQTGKLNYKPGMEQKLVGFCQTLVFPILAKSERNGFSC